MTIFVFDRVENIVGKGENAGYQHLKLGLCGKELIKVLQVKFGLEKKKEISGNGINEAVSRQTPFYKNDVNFICNLWRISK